MGNNVAKVKNILLAALIVLLILSGIFVVQGYLAGHFDSVESMQTYINSFGLLAPVVLGVIQALQVIIPVVPGMLGCIAGAGLFGAAGGFWCNYIGICAGSIISYLLARKFGTELVKLMFSMEKYKKWVDWVNAKKSFSVMLFLAILLPLAPDDFLCYFAGLTEMPAKRFTWIILLGKPWCILAYCVFFAYFI